MYKSIFPKKFRGSISKHFDTLKKEYQGFKNVNVLEIGTGRGFSANLLNKDISYTGIDISVGLLKQAVRRFNDQNFPDAGFYVSPANDLPFSNDFLI